LVLPTSHAFEQQSEFCVQGAPSAAHGGSVVDDVVVVVLVEVVVVVVVVVTNPSTVSGHGVPAEVHPSGISMHTNGNSAGAPVVVVHCFVFGGHTVNAFPVGPVGPCGPRGPSGAGGHRLIF
jgi:hypothetical protein